MSWEKVKLGELCTIEKGKTGILKAIPGEYPLVVTGEERKTHNEFQFDNEAVIIPLVSGTGHGHASIKRIFYQTGKFALGTILCAVIPKNKEQLSAGYLYRFLELNKEKELVSRMKGMANVTLPIKEIAEIEIPLPSLEEQIHFVEKYNNLEDQTSKFSFQLTHQLDVIKQLRQALLREAMQGKLVEQNLADEPASELLRRIKAEKEKLISEKKLKKEKELPPIKADEIPFLIPENWVWCRLGEICDNITKGSSPNWQGIKYVSDPEEGILFITSKNVDSYKIDLSKVTYVEKKFNKLEPRSVLKRGDLLTNIVGASIGRTALFNIDEVANINQAVCMLRLKHPFVNKHFMLYLMNSDFIIQRMYKLQFAPGRANLSMRNLSNFLIPLPTLPEQHRIIAKLEQLMQTCDALEGSIKESKVQNERLLEEVLREALRGGK
jgi:type I restriction enzyme, S subunit